MSQEDCEELREEARNEFDEFMDAIDMTRGARDIYEKAKEPLDFILAELDGSAHDMTAHERHQVLEDIGRLWDSIEGERNALDTFKELERKSFEEWEADDSKADDCFHLLTVHDIGVLELEF